MRAAPVSALGNERIKKIVTYIEGHYAEKITLRSIAAQIFLSPEECSRYFKKIIGTVPLCLYQPIPYQKEPGSSVQYRTYLAEVAQRCGFSTQSYYTSCFKKSRAARPINIAAARRSI